MEPLLSSQRSVAWFGCLAGPRPRVASAISRRSGRFDRSALGALGPATILSRPALVERRTAQPGPRPGRPMLDHRSPKPGRGQVVVLVLYAGPSASPLWRRPCWVRRRVQSLHAQALGLGSP